MLPPSNPDFQGQAVFDEKQPTSPFQNPSHLRKSLDRVRDRAHKVHVITTASTAASANGMCSADARSSDTGTTAFAIRLLATRSNWGDGSRATT